MMTWNYRIVKHSQGYAIHSAYYTDGKLDGLSESPASIGIYDELSDMADDLGRIAAALTKPVVDLESLEELSEGLS